MSQDPLSGSTSTIPVTVLLHDFDSSRSRKKEEARNERGGKTVCWNGEESRIPWLLTLSNANGIPRRDRLSSFNQLVIIGEKIVRA